MAENVAFELAMDLLGLGISLFIGRFAYYGYRAIGSPNLLRLTFAFVSIAAGFVLLAISLFIGLEEGERAVVTAGLGAQAVGYFFIAMSHGLKKSFDFAPSPRFAVFFILVLLVLQASSPSLSTTGSSNNNTTIHALASSHSSSAPPPAAFNPFVIPGNSIEHLIRSISFILLVYVSIETMASYMQSRRTSTLMIGSGLGALALAELMSWYNFIYPGLFSYAAITTKVAGFGLLFIPFSKFGPAGGFGGSGGGGGGRANSQVGSGV